MKFLVTGGAGFIGSNLVETLLQKGNEVIVVDNLTTGSLDNLSAVENRIKFLKGGAGQVLELEELKNIEGIYHLGIPSTTLLYRDNPLLIGEAVNDFIKILELAKSENCKVIYASSSSLYNGNKPPFNEEMPVLVKDFYTEARFLMERLARLYNDFYGVKSVGFRFFSVYGPHEENKKTFANLVSQFLWAMEKGSSPLIYGNGDQTRDFTYVGDIVEGFMAGMESDFACEIFNLGTNKCYSLNELVKILNAILGTGIKPEYRENPLKNYVQETLADAAKVKEKLGWTAKVSLEEGIKTLAGRKI
jgi:UDP-glucose 4-epimerase